MTCPLCQSHQVIFGSIGEPENIAGAFTPKGLKFLRYGCVPVKDYKPYSACAKCGHVWNKIDPAELIALIELGGTVESKNNLESLKLLDLPEHERKSLQTNQAAVLAEPTSMFPFKCAKCNTGVAADASSCANCGFVFGSA